MRTRIYRRRVKPPGSAPGTLEPLPEGGAAPTTLTLVRYDADGYAEETVPSVADAVRRAAPGGRSWLRVVGHDPAVLAELGSALPLHPLLLEDVASPGQRPKLEEGADVLFAVLQVLRPAGNGELDEEQVSVILFPGLLVTVEERENALFKPVLERLQAGRGRIRSAGLDYLAYAIVDAVVDYLFPVLDAAGERLEDLEAELLDRPDRSALEALHHVKRSLLKIRRVAWPTRELVSVLARGDAPMIEADTRTYVRDVYDHAVQVLDMVETFREMATGLVDLYLSSVSNRMNEVMKVLTIIATIFIPLGFIAGVYGMNFDTAVSPFNMPELKWPFGYPMALGIMLAVAVTMLAWFHRKRWL